MTVYLADPNPQPTLVKCDNCKKYFLQKKARSNNRARLSRAIKGAIAFVIKPFAPTKERK